MIGQALSVIITPIIALILIPLGILRGHRLDKALNDEEYIGDSLFEDMITIIKKFWMLLIDILSSVGHSLAENLKDRSLCQN